MSWIALLKAEIMIAQDTSLRSPVYPECCENERLFRIALCAFDRSGLQFLAGSRLVDVSAGDVKSERSKDDRAGGKHTYKNRYRLLGYMPIPASYELLVS